MQKREKEEKSFVEANDYILVCKKLKEVKAEHSLCIDEIKSLRDRLDALAAVHNQTLVDDENLKRTTQTAQKMVEQLTAQTIDIQYKAEKMVERKTQEFSELHNELLMNLEDYYMKLIVKEETIEKLQKVIILKEEDESERINTMSMLQFAHKLNLTKLEGLTEQYEGLQMRYSELEFLYENSEPTIRDLQLKYESNTKTIGIVLIIIEYS